MTERQPPAFHPPMRLSRKDMLTNGQRNIGLIVVGLLLLRLCVQVFSLLIASGTILQNSISL